MASFTQVKHYCAIKRKYVTMWICNSCGVLLRSKRGHKCK